MLDNMVSFYMRLSVKKSPALLMRGVQHSDGNIDKVTINAKVACFVAGALCNSPAPHNRSDYRGAGRKQAMYRSALRPCRWPDSLLGGPEVRRQRRCKAGHQPTP